MTFLQLVNKVLVRLREDTVSSVDENSYSQLIGEFVNDAVKEVEAAWKWSALRETLSATTQDGVFSYVLTGSGDVSEMLDVINDTSDVFMEYRAQSWFNNAFLNKIPDSASPRYYTFNGLDENGDTQVDIYPIPNGAYDLRFNLVKRTAELENDSDTVVIPTRPVLHLAVALATRERGESGGNLTPELFATYDKSLSDSVSLDAMKHPEETIFYTV